MTTIDVPGIGSILILEGSSAKPKTGEVFFIQLDNGNVCLHTAGADWRTTLKMSFPWQETGIIARVKTDKEAKQGE